METKDAPSLGNTNSEIVKPSNKPTVRQILITSTVIVVNAFISIYIYLLISSSFGQGAIGFIANAKQFAYLDLPALAYTFYFFELIFLSFVLIWSLSSRRNVSLKYVIWILPAVFIVQYLVLAAPNFVRQQSNEIKNDTPSELTNLDFSKPVKLDSLGGGSILVDSNFVAWQRYEYKTNGADLTYNPQQFYVFGFNQNTKIGKINEISGNKDNDATIGKPFELNGKLYFFLQDLQDNHILYEFDSGTSAKKVIFSVHEGNPKLVGLHDKDNLFLEDTQYISSNNGTNYNISTKQVTELLNVRTGQISDVQEKQNTYSSILYDGNYSCNNTGSIVWKDLNTNKTATLIPKGNFVEVSQCNNKFILYSSHDEFDKNIYIDYDWHLYDLSRQTDTVIYSLEHYGSGSLNSIKALPNFKGNVKYGKGYLVDNNFYYLDPIRGLIKIDLQTRTETILVSGNISELVFQNGFFAYTLHTPDDNTLYLLRAN